MVSQESVLPLCPVCNGPVHLEVAKTDENGRAIHEECYVLNTLTHQADTEELSVKEVTVKSSDESIIERIRREKKGSREGPNVETCRH